MSKSTLNQICQQHGRPLPIYTSKQNGQSHCPTFVASVHVFDGVWCGTGNTKKVAENYAAAAALDDYHGLETQNLDKPAYPNDVITIIMIDGENMPKMIKLIDHDSKTLVIAYFSKNHHMVNKKFPSHVVLCVSSCTRSNGCDIFMAMDCVRIVMSNAYPCLKRIIMCTRDKFAGAVVDNMKHFTKKVEVEHKVDF